MATTVHWSGVHFYCYGHALLDDLYPLFLHLQQRHLLASPLNITLRDKYPRPSWIPPEYPRFVHESIRAICQLTTLNVYHGADECTNPCGFLTVDRCGARLLELMRSYVLRQTMPTMERMMASPKFHSPQLRQFVDKFIASYQLGSICQEPDLVTCVVRRNGRMFTNLSEIVRTWQLAGYRVECVNFEDLSHRDQVKQVRRSKFLMSTFGSNLTNSIFLGMHGGVILCWPNCDAKHVMVNVGCMLQPALLAAGAHLFHLEKSTYDLSDVYANLRNPGSKPGSFQIQMNGIRLVAGKLNDVQWGDFVLVDFAVEIDKLRLLIAGVKNGTLPVKIFE